jgi:hypothetical protein
MKIEFVTYEQAVELQKVGFDEKCLMLWEHVPYLWTTLVDPKEFKQVVSERFTSAPLKQQVFRWFREKHNLYHIIHCPLKDVANFTIYGFESGSFYSDVELTSYEEAEVACIDKLIELVKK